MMITRTLATLGRVLMWQQLLATVLVAKAFSPRQGLGLLHAGWGVPKTTTSTITTGTTVKALIYAPSWESSYELDGEDETHMLSTYRSKVPYPDLADRISREAVSTLARLAVAFSPQGRKLHLRDIEHVEVLNVDENHMDIEAVVCSEEGCVTLAVPVAFPHPCSSSDGLNECVLSNLDELDVEASEVIRRIEWEEGHYEEIEAAKREMRVLQSTEDLHFPHWWVSPGEILSRELQSECASIRNLLNEADFASDVKAIATQALAASPDHEDWMVEQAAVSAVCPAGLLIRASVKEVALFQESAAVQMLEIPVAFQKAADTADDLRTAILSAVAAAGEFADD